LKAKHLRNQPHQSFYRLALNPRPGLVIHYLRYCVTAAKNAG